MKKCSQQRSICERKGDLELLLVFSEQDVQARPIEEEMKALDCSRSQQRSICERGGDLKLLLVFSEEDVQARPIDEEMQSAMQHLCEKR